MPTPERLDSTIQPLERLRRQMKSSPDLIAGGVAALLLLFAYTLVFSLTRDLGFGANFLRALQNTGPAVLTGAAAAAILRRWVLGRGPALQASAHLGMSILFALIWYFLVLLVLADKSDWWRSGFAVEPFNTVSFVWQAYQGVTLYGLVALGVYALHYRRRALAAEAEAERNEPPKTKADDGILLIKTGDEWRPVERRSIRRISGAGDYAEVVAGSGTVLSPRSLSWFEEQLQDQGFVRAHRSHLVRLGAVVAAEPAGNGRLTLHLEGGDAVTTSRSGTAAFKAETA